MQNTILKQYGQWLGYQLRQLGWQGNGALGLFILSALIILMACINDAQSNQLRKMNDALSRQTPAETQPKQRPVQISKRFYAALPSQSEANQKIADLLAIIERYGLRLDRSDYSMHAVPKSSMVLYQIKFPLQGEYPTIRTVVNQMMNSLQSIALTHIDFKRDDMRSELVKANLAFVLYTKADGKQP